MDSITKTPILHSWKEKVAQQQNAMEVLKKSVDTAYFLLKNQEYGLYSIKEFYENEILPFSKREIKEEKNNIRTWYANKINEINNKYKQDIENLKEEGKNLNEKRIEEINAINEEIKNIDSAYKDATVKFGILFILTKSKDDFVFNGSDPKIYYEKAREAAKNEEAMDTLKKDIEELNFLASIDAEKLVMGYNEISSDYAKEKDEAEKKGLPFKGEPEFLLEKLSQIQNEMNKYNAKKTELTEKLTKKENELEKSLKENQNVLVSKQTAFDNEINNVKDEYAKKINSANEQLKELKKTIKDLSKAVKGIDTKGNGIFTEEQGKKVFKNALKLFDKEFAVYLTPENFAQYHSVTDAEVKKAAKLFKPPQESEDIREVIKDINKYKGFVNAVHSPWHSSTARVLVGRMLGIDVNVYHKKLVGDDAKKLSGAMNEIVTYANSVLEKWFLVSIIRDINNEIYAKNSISAGIALYEKIKSEEYMNKLFANARSIGLIGTGKAQKKEYVDVGSPKLRKGNETESTEGAQLPIIGTIKPQFTIDGSRLLDSAWVEEAETYWKSLKKDTNSNSSVIDKMLNDLKNNKKATVADGFKVWKEINTIWLKNQKTLDRNEVDILLKHSENASMEELEVIWRIEITLFAKHRQHDLKFADSEINEMIGKINAEDDEYWPELYYEILKRLNRIGLRGINNENTIPPNMPITNAGALLQGSNTSTAGPLQVPTE
ncbi:MAG: hypothetical protein ACP5TL_02945 [Candidatus Micrarchaeia archaeon]